MRGAPAVLAALYMALAACAQPLSPEDLWRAGRRVPRPGWRGAGLSAAAAVLNTHLRRAAAHASVRPCRELSLADAHRAATELERRSGPRLAAVYRVAADRRSRTLGGGGLAREAELGAESAAAAELLRDGACHYAAMLWAHRLTAAQRAAVPANLTVPLLPELDHRRDPPTPGVSAEARRAYSDSVSCADCHGGGSSQSAGAPAPWPYWAPRMRIAGLTHGQFPFWCPHQSGGGGGGGGGGQGPINWSCNAHDLSATYRRDTTHRDDAAGSYHVVDHEKCNLTAWGVSGFPDCTHQWAQGQVGSHVFTKDGSFCCRATYLDGVRSTFYDTFAEGAATEIAEYRSDFYNGPATRHVLTSKGGRGNTNNFWYVSAPSGMPIEFGEGCKVSHDPSSCTGQNHSITFWTWDHSSVTVLGPDDIPADAPALPEMCTQPDVLNCTIGPVPR
eukprot:TRINITY_DN3740_c0_g1_i2.p1 TRINITY_DN3740_c0_g1~~TRINITY_DN3740_c0_g1_i2.p1  ORF type:complete len:468 (+),score=115.55 TRINITY_DN3740_c0_g1_i2:67-1404(+)